VAIPAADPPDNITHEQPRAFRAVRLVVDFK
jgi:hypothetical protein